MNGKRMAAAALLILAAARWGFCDGAAPFIDAKAVRERWETVTAEDMERLRGLRVVVASKSLGLNLVSGLAKLGRQDEKYRLAVQRYNVEKDGGLQVIPETAIDQPGLVLCLATRYPLPKRVEEVDELVRKPPWKFGGRLDAAMVVYSAVEPGIFPAYAKLMDGLVADYPRTRFIMATAGLNAEVRKDSNARMHAFSELLRERYRGRAPVYDLGALLSDDFRDGVVMRPEYTRDPTGVHPNTDAGELTMAKGFILALRDALRWEKAAAPPTAASPGPAGKAEALPSDHPEHKAVRAILDRNGLTRMAVEGQVVVRGGHVVELHLQEAGVTVIPDEIGVLEKLRVLHCYGNRGLPLPLLGTISPAIGKCRELEEILVNGNDLVSLPAEMAGLARVRALSVADNRLRGLPREVEEWARQRDPKGLQQQRP